MEQYLGIMEYSNLEGTHKDHSVQFWLSWSPGLGAAVGGQAQHTGYNSASCTCDAEGPVLLLEILTTEYIIPRL